MGDHNNDEVYPARRERSGQGKKKLLKFSRRALTESLPGRFHKEIKG